MTKLTLRGLALTAKLTVTSMALVFIGACGSTSPPPPGEVQVLEDEIAISGYLSEDLVEKIRTLTREHSFSRFRVDVYDGEPQATMQLGYYINRHQLDLVVTGECLGPCANYLFTAAANKYLERGAVVAWFGGALSASWTQQNQSLLIPGIRHVAEQYMDSFLRREIRFFQRIEVEQSITSAGYLESSGCHNVNHVGFYYAFPQLLRFGVTDVHTADGDWRTAFAHYPEQFCQVDLSMQHEGFKI